MSDLSINQVLGEYEQTYLQNTTKKDYTYKINTYIHFVYNIE